LAREPRFIGDMPHAWISSDYIRSVLDMFAYARDSDGALVLAPGVPASWLEGSEVIAVHGLRTPYGPLDLTIVPERTRWVVTLSGPNPPGGCVLQWPWAGAPDPHVTIDGVPAAIRPAATAAAGGELPIPRMPARIVIDRPTAQKR
jgi:hypothetical protein